MSNPFMNSPQQGLAPPAGMYPPQGANQFAAPSQFASAPVLQAPPAGTGESYGGRRSSPIDEPTRFSLWPVVLSYPYLDKPREAMNPGEDPKYQTELWFYEDDPSFQMNLGALMAATQAAVAAKWPAGKVPQFKNEPFRKLSSKEDAPEREGIFFNPKSKTKPPVKFNSAPPGAPVVLETVTDPDMVYPGVIACLTLNAYAYDQKGGKGVGYALNNVVLLKQGPRLGGGVRSAEQELGSALQHLPFGELGGGRQIAAAAQMPGQLHQQGYNPAQMYGQPQYMQQPPQGYYPPQQQMPPGYGYPQ